MTEDDIHITHCFTDQIIINIRDFLLINSHPGWIYQCCCPCCEWDSCCSQWYNLFVPLNLISLRCVHSLALTPVPSLSLSLSPRYSITRLQDALTLSPFSSYAVSEGVWKARAQQAALYSVQTWQQCERRCSFTQKRPKHAHAALSTTLSLGNLGADKMWIISDPVTTVRQIKEPHVYAHTRMLKHMLHTAYGANWNCVLGSVRQPLCSRLTFTVELKVVLLWL